MTAVMFRADAGGYQILMNFRGPARSFRTVSLTEVLEDQILPDLVRDRIVLIGPTASRLRDLFEPLYSSSLITAPQQTSGVEVQANLTVMNMTFPWIDTLSTITSK